ncbi:hypothetical protein Pcinc_017623 [Petrolisthes cinctipes]|uniref:Ionotropic glutamate receptor L-glutamate and glycine-binding domain-containing protein n=1 Tax=Petrolisthes cinctipes TaxID=88211 RepID=A0AAE1KML6_PETCI|nr:hypothetical protein Pcinc_017623 [Petrolisthes cinctipes]
MRGPLLRELGEAEQLLTEVVKRDMAHCSLLLLHDDDDALTTPLTHALHAYVSGGLSLGHLLPLVNYTTEIGGGRSEGGGGGGRCEGIVVVAMADTWHQLLQQRPLHRPLWPGHAPSFLLVLSGGVEKPLLDAPTLLSHPAFRFSVQVVCGGKRQQQQQQQGGGGGRGRGGGGGGLWELHTTTLYTGTQRHTTLHLDSWTSQFGFSSGVPLFPGHQLRDLEGYTFTVAALPYAPFIVTQNTSLSGPGKYRGLEVILLDVLGAAANFTYRYVAPLDTQWGRLSGNGTWTGMIGMVVREEADWAVSDITISPQREEYVDFCRPFIYDASELVTPKAQPLPRWLSPIRPFRWEVWMAVVGLMTGAGPFLWLLARFCRGSHLPRVLWFRKISNSVIFIIQPMLQRGNKQDMVEVPGRVFAGFWLFFSMIVGISYSSSLTSFLIMPGLQKPIENLRQLVTSDTGWAKVYFGGVQSALLEQTTDPMLVALREGVQWRDSLEGILKEVAAGHLATWDNSITTRLLVAIKFTDLKGRPMVHFPAFELLLERIAWPMQQHAPYKKRFDQLIDRVIQAGLVSRWLEFIIFSFKVSVVVLRC